MLRYAPLIFLVAASCLTACGTGPPLAHESDEDEFDVSSKDVSGDFGSEVGDVGTGGSIDLLAPDAGQTGLPRFVPPSTIICNASNDEIVYAQFPQEFSIPERPTRPFPGDITKHDDSLWLISTLRAPDPLAPGDGIVQSLFVQPGADVTLFSGFFVPENRFWEWRDGWGSYTVFVNGKPVEATFTMWDAARYEIVETITGLGYHPQLVGRRVWVDITVAAETFEPGHLNMIHLALRTMEADGSHIMSHFGKVAVYYGGYGSPTHACVAPAAPKQPLFNASDPQWSSETKTAYALGWVFPEGFSDWVNYRDGRWQEVTPGQVVRVAYELPSTRVKTVAIAPILDGVALEPLQIVSSGYLPSLPGEESFPPTTMARGVVEFQAPMEPGIHHFWVATWFDPYFPHEGPNTERVYFGPDYEHGRVGEAVLGSTGFGGTHTMTIEVVSPE